MKSIRSQQSSVESVPDNNEFRKIILRNSDLWFRPKNVEIWDNRFGQNEWGVGFISHDSSIRNVSIVIMANPDFTNPQVAFDGKYISLSFYFTV